MTKGVMKGSVARVAFLKCHPLRDGEKGFIILFYFVLKLAGTGHTFCVFRFYAFFP